MVFHRRVMRQWRGASGQERTRCTVVADNDPPPPPPPIDVPTPAAPMAAAPMTAAPMTAAPMTAAPMTAAPAPTAPAPAAPAPAAPAPAAAALTPAAVLAPAVPTPALLAVPTAAVVPMPAAPTPAVPPADVPPPAVLTPADVVPADDVPTSAVTTPAVPTPTLAVHLGSSAVSGKSMFRRRHHVPHDKVIARALSFARRALATYIITPAAARDASFAVGCSSSVRAPCPPPLPRTRLLRVIPLALYSIRQGVYRGICARHSLVRTRRACFAALAPQRTSAARVGSA